MTMCGGYDPQVTVEKHMLFLWQNNLRAEVRSAVVPIGFPR